LNRREQKRIGVELRAIESRQAVLDASLDDWQEVMDLALQFSTGCTTAYRRGGNRTRRLFDAAVLDEVHVRDGHVVDAAYEEPFDLLISEPKSNTTMWWSWGGMIRTPPDRQRTRSRPSSRPTPFGWHRRTLSSWQATATGRSRSLGLGRRRSRAA